MAQLGPTVGVLKPGGGMSMWEKSLWPSRRLSRPGRLIKALEHHTMQPKALPDKKVYKNIDPKSSDVYHLANQFR